MVNFLQHSSIVDAEKNAREVMQVTYSICSPYKPIHLCRFLHARVTALRMLVTVYRVVTFGDC